MKDTELLLTLTTNPKHPWTETIKEINELGIKRISFFPTYIEDINDRKTIYQALENSSVEEIPHVHLRDGMEPWELDYFIKKFNTKVFNIHETPELVSSLADYLDKIYVENRYKPFNLELLKKTAGLCVDFSHMEMGKRSTESNLEPLDEIINNYPIGCAHISPVSKKYPKEPRMKHFFDSLDEFDYMKQYKDKLPRYVSLEVNNSIREQITLRDYLSKKL